MQQDQQGIGNQGTSERGAAATSIDETTRSLSAGTRQAGDRLASGARDAAQRVATRAHETTDRLASGVQQAADRLARGAGDAADRLESGGRAASMRLDGSYDALTRSGAEMAGQARDAIRERPLTALALAAAFGYLYAKLGR